MVFIMKRRKYKAYISGTMAVLLTCSLTGTLLAGCGSGEEQEAVSQETQTPQNTEQETDALLSALSGNGQETGGGQGKTETVWLFADSSGQVTSTIVSGWLKNPEGEKYLTDVTDAENIVNVKGNEEFGREGNRYVWQADGNDIYYQGTTDKAAPVTERISYFLDGEEITAEELAGRSGSISVWMRCGRRSGRIFGRWLLKLL